MTLSLSFQCIYTQSGAEPMRSSVQAAQATDFAAELHIFGFFKFAVSGAHILMSEICVLPYKYNVLSCSGINSHKQK